MPPPDKPVASGSAAEVFAAFLRLGFTSFGGPVAHLGYFRRELVEKRGWLSEGQFGQLLAVCQFLPGPASSQLGFSLGLLRAGWPGALAAFLAFTLPSALLLMAFASALPLLEGPIGQAAIRGLKLIACAVVADAVLGMAKKLCPDAWRGTIAVVAAALLLNLGSAWAQMLVVAGGALAGMAFCRTAPNEVAPLHLGYGTRTGGFLLLLFAALLAALPLVPGTGLLPVAEAFYRAGALVFGGGHVVLPLLEESVVATGWITQETFLAGYGAAQAIPGPMFSFAAYLGAVIPTGQHSVLSAAVALAFMFMPGFLLVVGVLPFWRALAANRRAASAVAGVNAVVVGLLGAALYDPIFTSAIADTVDLGIALLAFALLSVWRLSALLAVGFCVAATVLRTLLF